MSNSQIDFEVFGCFGGWVDVKRGLQGGSDCFGGRIFNYRVRVVVVVLFKIRTKAQ